jgi:hypothetical protein
VSRILHTTSRNSAQTVWTCANAHRSVLHFSIFDKGRCFSANYFQSEFNGFTDYPWGSYPFSLGKKNSI